MKMERKEKIRKIEKTKKKKEDIFELTKCSAGDVNLLNNADGEILIF